MKFYFPVLLAALISYTAVAQKKELRAAQKLVDASLYEKALVALDEMQPLIENAEAKYSSHYYYLLGISKQKTKAFNEAIDAFDKTNSIEESANLKKYSSLIEGNVSSLTNDLINEAVDLNSRDEYVAASKLLHMAYELDPANNKDYLYYAASSAVNVGDYDSALAYYQELRDLDYTGSVEKFYATETETGEEIELSAENYKLFQKLKTYSNFRTEMTESKLPEIVKNIALIYVQQKQNNLAIGAIKEARAANPLDIGLILTEADLYINQLGDKQKFTDLMKEAIEKDPNNHILYFNLGVITAEQGDRAKARAYYETAIELDSTYAASYLNLAALILDGEQELVEKMNLLVNSNKRSDVINYDKMKMERKGLYLEAAPVLENLTKIDSSNVEALKTLRNIFYTLDDIVKYRIYKEKLEALGQ